MYLPDIFSAVFFLACAIYFFYGLLILSYNAKSMMHWLFFFCCLDMSLWALSFSMGNIATNYESCLFWRRIALFGWGPIFSFFLHYVLLLTENSLLKKKWIYPLLYVPVFLNIFLYGIFTPTAVQSYNLVQTNFGWINIAGNTILDWYYDLYYLSFTVIGIILLIRWGLVSKDIAKRKQAFLIGGSFTVAMLIGTLTEYVINYFLREKVPQLAPIIILLPVSVILYCIRRFQFMRTKIVSKEPEADQILSEHAKSKLYFYLSITYMIAGFVNFWVQFLSRREQVDDILLFSLVIFGMGLVVCVIQNLRIRPEYKQLSSNIAYVASIPVITLKYTSVSGIYAWVVPVFLMLVAIAFNQRQMLYLIWVTTFATFTWLWVKVPVLNITFSTADHISRLIILAIILWFTFYISRTYLEIINVNKEKVRLEKLLNQISNIFLTTNEKNIDEKIVEAMQLIGSHFNLDCIHLSLLSNGVAPDNDYEWYASGIDTAGNVCARENLQELIAEVYHDQLVTEGRLFIAGSNTSAEDAPISELLNRLGMKSLVIRPMKSKNQIIGILCLGSTKRILTWGEQQQQTANLLVHLITDLWVRLDAERELYFQANYDMLTGLPNRNTFFKHLNREISNAEQTGKRVGVIFIDVDSFKAVNDSVGHESGDSILVQIGRALSNLIRSDDFLARFGGDEFLIMIPQEDTVEDIKKVVDSIMNSFQKSYTIKGQEFHISASAGISVYPDDGTDPETLVKNADLAMYRSKEHGKNQYTCFSEDIKAEILRKIRLIEDLHGAFERNEFQLYYQPQISAASKKIIGIEALLRWFHPEFGSISPGVFIPVAEQIGLINYIGDWVLMTACLQCRAYHLKGLSDIRVGVNVSIIQIQNPEFAGRVRQILEETRLEPRYLELEITENIAVRESDKFIEALNSLKELGVSISIDDFGTEYSSLSRLCVMPIDRIKLDIQFIRRIGRSDKENAIIRSIIDLAHTLGLKVTAEGVESEMQLKFLTESGVDEIQGFYYYKPLPPEDMEQILREIS